MTTTTINYAWLMPDPGGSANTWGNTLNGTTQAIDAKVKENELALANYMPLAGGGAVTGNLSVSGTGTFGAITTGPVTSTGTSSFGNLSTGAINTSGTVIASGAITAGGNVTGPNWVGHGVLYPNYAANSGAYLDANSGGISLVAGGKSLSFNAGQMACDSLNIVGGGSFGGGIAATGSGAFGGAIYPANGVTGNNFFLTANASIRFIQWAPSWTLNWQVSTGLMYYQCPAGAMHQWDGSGNYSLGGAGNGFKSGGGPWAATSDERTKKDVQPYQSGLDQILRLNPVAFRYNGQGGTDTSDKVYYGVIAQAVKPVMPELVIDMDRPRYSTENGSVLPRLATMLEGQLGTDLGPLTLALVNAVKELSARVAELEAR